MAMGGLAGMLGVNLPSVETGIALSPLVFGVVIAFA
jgi:urease accessory protein